MTHTSTEQPEALRLADALRDGQYSLYQERAATEAELRRLHARVQELEAELDNSKASSHQYFLERNNARDTVKKYQLELEASQAQRVPLSERKIRQIDAHSGLDAIEFARAIERAHGITQEKQG